METTVKQTNLDKALEFLLVADGKGYTPDYIKEHTTITCSHASIGRILRRAEQAGRLYDGRRLRRAYYRSEVNNEDIVTFYLDFTPVTEQLSLALE